MFNKFAEKNSDYFYVVFRVVIGLVFLLHGIMKLPGMIDGSMVITGVFFWAGVIELVGGSLLILGLFTRYVAFVAAIEMLVAFFMVHTSKGVWHPLYNGGEAALLFFAAFLVLIAYGARKWSLDNLLGKG